MEQEAQTVEAEKEVKGKLVFSFDKPTPKWATHVFRAVFIITTAGVAIITFEPDISPLIKVRYLFYLKVLDFVIWGFGRGLGIDKNKFVEEQAGNAIGSHQQS